MASSFDIIDPNMAKLLQIRVLEQSRLITALRTDLEQAKQDHARLEKTLEDRNWEDAQKEVSKQEIYISIWFFFQDWEFFYFAAPF